MSYIGSGYSDEQAREATDGQIDAATLDGAGPSAYTTPSSTGSASQSTTTGGYEPTFQSDGSDGDLTTVGVDNLESGSSHDVPVGWVCDGFRIQGDVFSGDDGLFDDSDVVVHFEDSTTESTNANLNNSLGSWLEVNHTGGLVEFYRVSITDSGGDKYDLQELQPHRVALPDHSHTI